MPPILITGAAGFIGFHAALRLLRAGVPVVGVDCFTSYYDLALKEARAAELARHEGFALERVDLADAAACADLFARVRPARVIHLAAQPGVRRALTEPQPYVTANVVAFLNVLEGCRHGGVEHLVYASSSSVYGANGTLPFSERHSVDHPVSLYAATKKSNELMAHAYSHLFGLPATGLRFFTVYGPWGRPDMAVYTFTHAIAQGRPIEVANGGRVWRDFTYVDDVVEGILRVSGRPAAPDPAWDARRKDEHLSFYNRYSLPIVSIHEVYPGHYYQLLAARRSPSRVRAVLGAGSFIEGWAHYAEQSHAQNTDGRAAVSEQPVVKLAEAERRARARAVFLAQL